jgi:isoaspartyl peptidase/L-asparaginase-like protein (Ntn-hydrolase superfamily)
MTRWRLVIHGGAGSERIAHDDPAHEAHARAGLEEALKAGAKILGRRGSAVDAVESAARLLEENACFNAGRGSVLTQQGDANVAAATSTGGITAKRWGRVGDSPLIGAGTYADNRAAAVSATGAGEYFIRAVAAHEVAARIRLGGQSLQEAIDGVLADIAFLGGKGGLIAVAPSGDAAWGFTTPAMYRGIADAAGTTVKIYADEDAR